MFGHCAVPTRNVYKIRGLIALSMAFSEKRLVSNASIRPIYH
jgi:hypothetical protein